VITFYFLFFILPSSLFFFIMAEYEDMAIHVGQRIGAISKSSMDKASSMLKLPEQIYERSSTKAFLRLTKSVVLVTVAYFLLAQLPWYLLPLGWVLTGTTLASLLAVGYACRKNNFFNNTFINHFVGQLCLIPLMIPFESWHARYTKEKESFKNKITAYLSYSHFWWCTSLWQSLLSNLDAFPSLFYSESRKKRLIGNLCLLYLFAAIFFPLITYNLGLWGLAKYYLIPLMVYHFWASSFLKTSSLFELLEINNSDFVTLVYYKYPKWVEFLSDELNLAFSSLQKLSAIIEPVTIEPKKVGAAEADADEKKPFVNDKLSSDDYEQWSIPYYNVKDALKLLKDSQFTKSIEVKFQELSFFSLLKSRTGVLIETLEGQSAKAKDVIAEQLSDINWVTTLYLIITPLLSLWGLLTLPYYWQTWVLFVVHYFLGGLGITAGYHRLWSHRAYSAHPIFKYFLLFVSTGAFQMSVFDWCIDHRAHHRYTDTDKDPYSISKGFWYAHIGWLLKKRAEPVVSDIRDLEADPALQFQHKYYPWLAIFEGFLLPTFIAGYFWGDWMGGLFIAAIFSRTVASHATFCVNSVAHFWGEWTYSDQRSPRDSWLVGLITFGEGYHNFHHEFPYDYRNGAQYQNYDPTKWLIWLLSWVGITYDLKYFSEETIQKGQIQMKEKLIAMQRAALHWGPPEETLPTWSMDKVQQSVKDGEMLMVCEGYVHDVRLFIKEHPAGSAIMKPYIGKDISKQFNGGVYNHSNAARNILQTLRVAKLDTSASASSCCSAAEVSEAVVEESSTMVDGKQHAD